MTMEGPDVLAFAQRSMEVACASELVSRALCCLASSTLRT